MDCKQQYDNIKIHSRQTDVSRFYNQASLVLNLSKKEHFVETFGLTALEAMTAGLPVIVPTEGGIAEMVVDGKNGYKIDVADIDKIKQTIVNMLSDGELYKNLSAEALTEAHRRSGSAMIDNIISHL